MSSSQDIAEILYSILPEDGSAIGNASALTQMRVHVPDLSEEDYAAARDALVASGRGVKGRGRGGSIARAVDDDLEDEDPANGDEDAEDEGEDEFALESAEEPAARQRKSAKGKRKSSRANGPVQVVSYRHHNKRSNNPEVGIVHPENDPDQPKTTYAYDPHIDPALMFDTARTRIEKVIDNALASGDVDTMKEALLELKRMQAPYLNWAGKAERTSFEIDTVSLHVHERVDPATILANARKRLKGEKAGEVWRQADLFAAPFENLPLRQAVDFYRHEKGWSNRLIAGDSLLVMNSLLQKESMAGKVQMIYIDPPYGIKYGSNFQPFVGKRDVKDGADDDLTQEPEMIKAFRDTWELGIHSYLTYLRDRLVLAKELLRESGSIIVQISDENVHHVRELMDEVFGPSNFFAQINFKATSPLGQKGIAKVYDYLIWYSKDPAKMKFNNIFGVRDISEDKEWRFVSHGHHFEKVGRRFWPVKVGQINTDGLSAARDQLFAEAMAYYYAKHRWWPDALAENWIRPEQEARYEADAWESAIAGYLQGRSRVMMLDVARDALEIVKQRLGTSEQRRIVAALERLGWQRAGKSNAGQVWTPRA